MRPCCCCRSGSSVGLGGQLLGALVTAGAFAAFLSTASGLTVSVAGVISQDVPWGRGSQVRAFRAAAVPAIVVPYLLSLPSEHLGLAAVVGLAFAVAAATFCPLLVLGIWWRGLTSVGRDRRAGRRWPARPDRGRSSRSRRRRRRLDGRPAGRTGRLGGPDRVRRHDLGIGRDEAFDSRPTWR